MGISLSEWPTAHRQPEPYAQDRADAPFWNIPQPGVQAELWLQADTVVRFGGLAASSIGGGLGLLGIAVKAGPGTIFNLMGGGELYVRPKSSSQAISSESSGLGPVLVAELNRATSENSVVGGGILVGHAPWGSFTYGCSGQLGCMTPDVTGVYSARVFVPYARWNWKELDMKLGIAPATKQPLMIAAGLRF